MLSAALLILSCPQHNYIQYTWVVYNILQGLQLLWFTLLFVVLSQVKTFLPALIKANKVLHETMKKEGREQVDIECVEDQKRHIEMVYCTTDFCYF